MGLFDKFKKPSAGKSRTLQISDYLAEKQISFFHAGPSKRQVFGSLIGSFDLANPGEALKAIMAREEAGSTVIGPGLALPHARIAGINRIQAALGICPSGIQYSSAVEEPVKLLLLFLGPSDNMREHLAFLASASALLQKDGTVTTLLAQPTPDALLKKIKELEKIL